MREFRKEIEAESLAEEYGGDRGRAYDGFMSFNARKYDGLELARMRSIQDKNKGIIEMLGSQSFESVIFCPVDEDLAHWKTISQIYEFCGRKWKTKTLRNLHGAFDIWKLICMFKISWGNPENEERVLQLLLGGNQFLETFYPAPDEDEDGEDGEASYAEFVKPITFYTLAAEDTVQVD